MSAAFDRAAIFKPFTVLGRKLKAFSLGHEILLAASGNAYAKESERTPEFLPDLALAVRICECDYERAIKSVCNVRRQERWMRKQKSLAERRRVIPVIELLKFSAYLRHYRSGPEFTRKGDISASVVGAPFEQTLKVFLCTRMGFSIKQALNYSHCSAVADYLTFLEGKGALTIVDSLDELERDGARMQPEIIEKSRAMMS